MYTRLPAALLPKGFRGALSMPRGASSAGAAASSRLTEFIRGVVTSGTGRGDRAAAAAMESKLERKTMHLDNAVSGTTEAQSAGARGGRAAGSGRNRGLSGKQCKKKVSRGATCRPAADWLVPPLFRVALPGACVLGAAVGCSQWHRDVGRRVVRVGWRKALTASKDCRCFRVGNLYHTCSKKGRTRVAVLLTHVQTTGMLQCRHACTSIIGSADLNFVCGEQEARRKAVVKSIMSQTRWIARTGSRSWGQALCAHDFLGTCACLHGPARRLKHCVPRRLSYFRG